MRTDQPEKKWLSAYKNGDTAALGLLVEHFRKPLFAYIYNMLQGRGDAEEIYQDVWLRVIKNIGKYREKNFAGWLFRIAHNLYVDQVRKKSHVAHPIVQDVNNEDAPMIERHPSKKLTPDRQVEAKDLGIRILAAVAKLPDDQREVFMMRTEADIPFKEIAKIQKTSLNTALARMHYALQKMRPLLQEDYDSLGGGKYHE